MAFQVARAGPSWPPKTMKNHTAQNRNNLEIKPGDLLMSRASGSEDLIGSVALVPDGTRGRPLLSDKTYRLKWNETTVVPAFVARVLQSPVGRSH